MAVAGQLNAVCETRFKIVHEDHRGVAVAPANEPRWNELVSASIAVQVQTSPAFAGAAFARAGRVSFLVCPRHALFKLAHYASRALLDTGIGGR
jgi:hypothetical protein